MPFKSEAQRKYLWANEPKIARDWTDTYGSKIHKADGGIADQGGMRNHLGEQPMVNAPKYWRSGPDAPPTELAYVTEAEKDLILKSNLHGSLKDGPNEGPSGIISLDSQGDYTPDRSGNTNVASRDVLTGQRDHGQTVAYRGPREKDLVQTKTGDYRKKTIGDRVGDFRQGSIDNFVRRNKYKNLIDAGVYPKQSGMIAKVLGYMNPDEEVDQFDVDDIKNLYAGGADPKGLADLRRDFEFEEKYDRPTQTQFEDYYGLNPPPDTGGGGGGGQIPWWLRQQAPVASIPDTTTTASTGLGGGHFQVPLAQVLNQQRAAEGGIIGSVGGISRPKYQEGNMVGAEMGAELKGAVLQSKEVIAELYNALISQGLSPQEAMEELKRMFEGIRAQGPEAAPSSPDQGPPEAPIPELGGGLRSAPREQGPGGRAAPREQGPGGRAPPLTLGPERPMMGEEFPGQEFRGRPRAPAAFGGIMDTYTGRRKYGLGSFISKALKKVKKLASSKLGKMALMYAAGTYLGGTQAFGGTGQLKFADRLRDPKLLANLINPTGSGVGEGKGWSMFQKAAPNVTDATWKATVGTQYPGATTAAKALETTKKAGDWSKWILPASLAAGAYTAAAPVEGLDDTTSEYDEKKAAMDAYLADMEGAYRLPENLRAAQGGRIGKQEGGIMDLGGMEKDYRNDGGFVPLGGEEKADDVPARLSRNEFVFTADAVRNAGGGDIDRGAEVMENVMKNLEAGGKVSEESQGQGAQEMFETSERLSEII